MNTHIGFSFCLMTLNWHEFGDFLLFADDWDVIVNVNTVTHPRSLSLYHLPAEELQRVVKEMESKDEFYRQRLGRNKEVWVTEFTRLRHAVENFSDSRSYWLFWGATFANSDDLERMTEDRATRLLMEWGESPALASILCDNDHLILDCDMETVKDLQLQNDELIGTPLSEMQTKLGRMLGPDIEFLKSDRQSTHNDDIVLFRSNPDTSIYVRAISIPIFNQKNEQSGLRLLIGTRRSPEPTLVQLQV
jgi:hypothetical protein